MAMEKLEIGQRFNLIGVEYPELGTVVRIEEPFIYVATSFGVLRFNDHGYECDSDGTLAEGHYLPQFVLPFTPRLSLRGEKIEFL
jgi:hypothetical protein